MESLSSSEAAPEQTLSQAAKRRTGAAPRQVQPRLPPPEERWRLRAVIAVRMFKSLSVLRLDTAHHRQYSINYGKFSVAGSPPAVRFVRYIIAAPWGL